MRRIIIFLLVSIGTGGLARAVETAVPQSTASTEGACTSSGTSAGACWQAELGKVQSANAACQAEIDQFCEGIQVGQGRIENCLKAHKKKLSPKCKTAQGLR